MAIDEALLASFAQEHSPPILRTYGWHPSALSLGRFQNATEVLDLERCRNDSIDIVRRVSGGGTIYHSQELTYSIVCSQEQIPYAASVKDSFRVLTGFLIEFYRSLGLAACYAVDAAFDHTKLGTRTAYCFAGKETFDILIDGKKIGGNAQRRRRNIIFQHGSIPINNRSRYGLQYMREHPTGCAENTISLSECGVSFDISQLKKALIAAFKCHMGAETIMSSLSQAEQCVAQELSKEKYGSDQWNLKGVLSEYSAKT